MLNCHHGGFGKIEKIPENHQTNSNVFAVRFSLTLKSHKTLLDKTKRATFMNQLLKRHQQNPTWNQTQNVLWEKIQLDKINLRTAIKWMLSHLVETRWLKSCLWLQLGGCRPYLTMNVVSSTVETLANRWLWSLSKMELNWVEILPLVRLQLGGGGCLVVAAMEVAITRTMGVDYGSAER